MFVRSLALSAIAVVALGACSDDEKPSLLDVTEATTCGTGGITIRRGIDDNENGRLDGNEIDSTRDVCNTPNNLLVTSAVTAGSDGCTFGGTRIASGLDNGDGGGTAGNGALEAGEIDETRVVCQGEGFFVRSFEAPSGADGANLFVTSGGAATNGPGGDGGDIEVLADNGSLGGHVKAFRNGSAPVTITAPALTPAFGSAPVVIEGNVTINTVADPTALAANTPYRDPGGTLLIWNGSNSVNPSGLRVAAGASLTFGGVGPVQVALEYDIDIAGTVMLRDGINGRDLVLAGRAVVVRDSGTIDLSGAEGGGNAGQLTFSAYAPGSTLVVAGTLNLAGGPGTAGGNGGRLIAGMSRGAIYAVGDINLGGGTGTSGNGGPGGSVVLDLQYGSVAVAGTVSMRGGDGTVSGGLGGNFTVGAPARCDVTATLNLSGGNGATGGDAGELNMSIGGGLHFAGSVIGRGGVASGTNGGRGSQFSLFIEAGDGYSASESFVGDTTFSGSVDLRGGAGVSAGGYGGDFQIEADYDEGAFGQEIVFYGVPLFDTRGGSGSTYGGYGAQVSFQNGDSDSRLGVAGGGVFVTSDINTSGADGSTDTGGGSGFIDFETSYTASGSANPNARVVSTGALIANGGNGTDGGSMSGMYAFGMNGVELRGSLSGNGGVGTTANGGSSGAFDIYAEKGPVTIAATIVLRGGNGAETGGDVDTIEVSGATISCAGEWSATGGAGGTIRGGNGSQVAFISTRGDTTLDPDLTVQVTGGTGASPGTDGWVLVNGSDVTAALAD